MPVMVEHTPNEYDRESFWGPSVPAYRGPKYADDHINLKELKSDTSGEVFAVIKTSRGDAAPNNPNDPQIVVLTLQGNALWSPSAVFGTVQENHTRPILMIDEQNHELTSSPRPIVVSVPRQLCIKRVAWIRRRFQPARARHLFSWPRIQTSIMRPRPSRM